MATAKTKNRRKKGKAAKAAKRVEEGTIRIRARDLRVVEKTRRSWKVSSRALTEAMEVIRLFRAHNDFGFLIDKKDTRFLKGQLSPEGRCQGARIKMLPDGRKLDKAYSLFAEHLTIHDESSNEHWDVLYRNPGGTYSYGYVLEKKERALKRKYRAVSEFGRLYPKLMRRVYSALKNRKDRLAVPVYTLLKTYMRVGNEIYYKAHGHKGMTTLKKSDITIRGKAVTFKYLGKDGVPRSITESFPAIYITRLREMLKPIKRSSFVFVNPSTGHPLRDTDFEHAFRRYCGRPFYPQIVRSYYATTKAMDFARAHKRATREEVRSLFLSIAGKLGHRRFSKKERSWKENYNVTTHYYIRPDIVERINSLVK